MDKRVGQAIAVIAVLVIVTILVVAVLNPQGTSSATKPFTYTESVPVSVNYDGYNIAFVVHVERAVGDSGLEKTMHLLAPGSTDASTISTFYQRMAADPSQASALGQLSKGFLHAKDQLGLTDDEFVDIVVKYVQDIEYVTTEDLSKYPVETIADKNGDCDDRALLLAGILAEAGYDVSLFYFKDEAHMATGIAVEPGYDFMNTGYAFIETTTPAFIGNTPPLTGGSSVKNVVPEVIPIGNGEKKYTAMEENKQILKVMEQTQVDVARLSKLIDAQKERVELLQSRLSYYSGMHNKDDYQLKYDEYVRAVGLLNGYVKDYNKNVEVYNFIIQNAGERKLVYNYLFPVN